MAEQESRAWNAITEDEIRDLGTYDIVEHRMLKDLNSDSYLLRHKKTGARIALLPNEDSNKVFFIAFRTPPVDSTGVAHIIEHTVLCGSDRFPVKDPFIEIAKGSLNTFLNAMTYPDKTVYPIASVNHKDFANLMHVYLDAVFYPNIYKEENIFRQEGWHYEALPHKDADGQDVIDMDSQITINGVVYNEMKGALSSPEDLLNDKILASLYPDTTYAIVSGGDPAYIPDLKYKDYLDFHRRYYHPSNSYIYLYGDLDVKERLRFLDEEYLGSFEHLDIDSSILPEPPFSKLKEMTFPYPVMQDEDTEDKAFLSYNVSIPVRDNPKENLAFKILDYVLCDCEGAPVKKAIRDRGIGEDVESLYESGVLQPFFSIIAKYADAGQKDEFVTAIDQELMRLADQGIGQKAILAGINNYEFHYREADFGGYPKGLIYGLDAMDSWLYDDLQPWVNLEIGNLFDELRKDAEGGYFEKLIRKLLLQNPHKSVVLLTPEPGLTEKNEEALRCRLDTFAASLSPEQRQEIADQTIRLRKWQETPDTKEDLEKIPMLGRDDLGRQAQKPVNHFLKTARGTKVLTHPVFTGGIDYINLVFDITDMPEELYHNLVIFKTLICVMDTKNFSYKELDQEINIRTGGITPSISSYTQYNNLNKCVTTFEVSVRSLHDHLHSALELVSEIVTGTDYSDTSRALEVLEEECAALKAQLPAAGHSTAASRAVSYISGKAAKMEEVSGLSSYEILSEVCEKLSACQDKDDMEAAGIRLAADMHAVAEWIFCREHLLFDITASEEDIQEAGEEADLFAETLSAGKPALSGEYQPVPVKKNEGFTTAGQVQYVCRAGSFADKGYTYTGALRVLKAILGYDYLWQEIRVKGGAYGCMSSFGRDGISYFVTYRDPHLQHSLDVFEKASGYIRGFEADERTMTKYLIGAVSGLDRPMTASVTGRFSLACYMTGITDDELQRERDEVLGTDVETIRSLGDLVDAFMSDDCLCVVGTEEKIREHEELFSSVRQLI